MGGGRGAYGEVGRQGDRGRRRVGTRPRSAFQHAKCEAGLWQRRSWEGCVQGKAALAAARCYVWWNPVRYGLMVRPAEWPWSGVHREIVAGRMAPDGW